MRRTPIEPLAASVAALAVRNVAEPWVPKGAYVPLNALAAVGLIRHARRRGGVSMDELGLGPGVTGGARLGAGAGLVVAALLAVASRLPGAANLFDDERVEVDGGRRELVHQLLWRIPLGTAGFEEVAFRGVLQALATRRFGTARGVALTSVLFGLWHVVPTVRTADRNGIAGRRRSALVVAAVASTAASGAAFSALHLRAGNVAAPAVLHAVTNTVAYALAWHRRSVAR